METNKQYQNFLLSQAPRLLSQIDRDKDSPTYGCCDRNFWHYKIRDFSSAILQQSGLGLALLYSYNFPENIYYKKKEIKNLSIATVQYWEKIQYGNGSFNEYWPNEQGFPPTVFSLFSACEIIKIFKIVDIKILKAVEKSAKYILKYSEKQALNQEMAAIAALYNAGIVLKKRQYTAAATKRFKKYVQEQNTEGWFVEYGGADFGYLTVTLNFMGEYYRVSKDSLAKESLFKIVEYIKYFIHPDGTLGGDYGSRNTEYYLPAGFELTYSIHPASKTIVFELLKNIGEFPIDDRYLGHYIFHSFARALIVSKTAKKVSLPWQEEFTKVFSESAFIIVSTKKRYYIVSASKGGVIVAYNKLTKERVLNDTGYRAYRGRKIAVTNWVSPDNSFVFKNNILTMHASFNEVGFHKPSPLQHFGLRVLSFFFKRRLIPFMKKIFIFSSKKSDIALRRVIDFSKQVLTDKITSDTLVDKVESTHGLSLRYCPSSKYYQVANLHLDKDRKLASRFRQKTFTSRLP